VVHNTQPPRGVGVAMLIVPGGQAPRPHPAPHGRGPPPRRQAGREVPR
jgi:hypothetical protein